MTKGSKGKKKDNTLSNLLDLLDLADRAVEKFTGKNIPAWLNYLQEQAEVEGQKSETGVIGEGSVFADPYAVLGLPQNASVEQVKRRYRQLSMVYHPDREGGYNEAMKRVNQAYQEIMKRVTTRDNDCVGQGGS